MSYKQTMTPEELEAWERLAKAGDLFDVTAPAPSHCRQCAAPISRYARNFCSPHCRAAWWAHYHEVKRETGHGTGHNYRYYGCRCDPCKAAQSVESKASYQRRKANR